MFDSPQRDQTRPEDAGQEEPDELDAAQLLASLRELPAFQVAPTADTAVGSLLQRMEELRRPLHEFCRQNQLREGCLSKAMIRGCTAADNEWNVLQHQLALGRQASALQCGQRMSNAQAWTNRQMSLHKGKGHMHAKESPVHMVTHFGSHEGLQVLLFEKEDGSVAEALTLSVYRGAVLTGDGARRLKVCRPSPCPLPASLCQQSVRVVELAHFSKHCWCATSVSPHFNLEPQDILAQWSYCNVDKLAERTSFRFSDEVTHLLKKGSPITNNIIQYLYLQSFKIIRVECSLVIRPVTSQGFSMFLIHKSL